MNRRLWIFFGGVLIVSLVTAGLISQLASTDPDGLEYVAEREGFAVAEAEHDLADAPLADYGSNLGTDSRLGRGIAGISGVLLTLAVGYVVFRIARRPKGPHTASD